MSDDVNADPYIYNGWPMNTPMDIRLGLTHEDGIHHKLRWGIISASSISSDWVKSLQDVPGASVAAIAARDMDRAQAFAEAHEIPTAYDSYQALCEDANVDIVYIASKTWDHHRDLMMAVNAGKHILCEKPFTDTADQAKEVYAAAAKAGVVCWEGMWLRFFPAVEHARTAMARGDIGEVRVVQADYPDRVYALNPAITGFGADEMPLVVAAGRKARAQSHAGGTLSAHGGSPSAAVLQYSDQEGIAVITFPNGRFIEESQYIGTQGRITIETPSHHPSAVAPVTRREEGKPPIELVPAVLAGDPLEPGHPSNGASPSRAFRIPGTDTGADHARPTTVTLDRRG